jgi:hypothetical protein
VFPKHIQEYLRRAIQPLFFSLNDGKGAAEWVRQRRRS